MSLRAALRISRAGAASTSNADSAILSPGDVVGGKYRIDARIAEGGMGMVLRATHLDLDCPVAIKLIRPEHVANEEVVARLLAEARIAAGLRSKHVNRVLDLGRTDAGVPYLVLEYMEGSDLCCYLARRERLPVSEAVDHVMQACEALAEAHALGIVHRDLKPENLFLSEEADGGFVLKVFDFGISKAPAGHRASRGLTNALEVVGSPSYMSPEQISGSMVDARSDIWALGAILYELCSGITLFDGSSITDTFAKVLNPPDVLPPLELGPSGEVLQQVIVKCLKRNADERYQDVVELARDLAPLGTDEQQAGRVAKVAAAARARAIAMAGDSSGVMMATPMALTTSQLEGDVELAKQAVRSRPRFRWVTLVVAASGLLTLGASYLARTPAQPTRITVVEATSPADPARSDATWLNAPSSVAQIASASTSEPERPRPESPPRAIPTSAREIKPWQAKVRAAEPAPRVAQAATPGPAEVQAVAAPESAEPKPEIKAMPSDAWDPKSFGGRR